MHGGIGADEVLLPTRGWAFAVVAFQRFLVVGALVAENLAKGVQLGAVRNQPIPKVMPNLMAKMPQKGAIGLLLQRTLLLAVHVIRFCNVDGDQSIVVSRQDALRIAIARILQELERKARALRGGLWLDRQP